MFVSERIWIDISKEYTRTYHLTNGKTLLISKPTRVGIKRVQLPNGVYLDSHVVETSGGNGFYIKEFEAISWTGRDSTDPAFGDRFNALMPTTVK